MPVSHSGTAEYERTSPVAGPTAARMASHAPDLIAAVTGRGDECPVVEPLGERFVLAGHQAGQERLVENRC